MIREGIPMFCINCGRGFFGQPHQDRYCGIDCYLKFSNKKYLFRKKMNRKYTSPSRNAVVSYAKKKEL